MPLVFPVVHVTSSVQAVDQTVLARSAGADGVYLIDHGSGSGRSLETVFNEVVGVVGAWFVGINFLGIGRGVEAFDHVGREARSGGLVRLPDAIWVDDALPLSSARLPYADVPALKAAVPELASVTYLGGVAFKYTATYTDDPRAAAGEVGRLAPHVDVVTTSGPGTGRPPPPGKIAAMKLAAGDQRLAVASGVDAGNVASYAPHLDIVLAASSIETQPYSGVFDPIRLTELIDAAHR